MANSQPQPQVDMTPTKPDEQSEQQSFGGNNKSNVYVVTSDDNANQKLISDNKMVVADSGDNFPGMTFQQYHWMQLQMQQYSSLQFNRIMFLVYIFALLIYIGENMGLFACNFYSQDYIESHYYLVFHMLEFWFVFAFTALEALLLLSTQQITFWPQTLLVCFNTMFSFLIAIMFSVYPSDFEVPSHWCEYSLQVCVCLANFFFIYFSSFKADQDSLYYKARWFEIAFAVVIFLASILELLIYSDRFSVGMEAERAAHFVEYLTESASACIALLYSVYSYQRVSTQLQKCDTWMADHCNHAKGPAITTI